MKLKLLFSEDRRLCQVLRSQCSGFVQKGYTEILTLFMCEISHDLCMFIVNGDKPFFILFSKVRRRK